MDKLKVILPLKEIQNGEMVSKISGQFKYKVVKDSLSIYEEGGANRHVKFDKGTVALMNGTSITICPESKEVILHIDADDFAANYIDEHQ